MALWEGAARRFAETGRLRHGQWLADGASLVAVSDASGEERVVVFAANETRVLPWDAGHIARLRAHRAARSSRWPTIATKCWWATLPAASW